MKTHNKYFNNGKRNYTTLEDWVHELLILLIGVIVKKLETKMTPYTMFAFVMLMFSFGWFGQMLMHITVWKWHEILVNAVSNWVIIILSFACIVSYKIGKFVIYKHASLILCQFCLGIGVYWLIIDLINFESYSTSAVVSMGFMTDLLRMLGGGLLLLNYNEEDFRQ